jgi:hypothetical protein
MRAVWGDARGVVFYFVVVFGLGHWAPAPNPALQGVREREGAWEREREREGAWERAKIIVWLAVGARAAPRPQGHAHV